MAAKRASKTQSNKTPHVLKKASRARREAQSVPLTSYLKRRRELVSQAATLIIRLHRRALKELERH